MDIKQLRQKLPHLAQLDDAHLIDVVQRIYYPKVDKAVLAERLGVKVEAPMPEEPGLLRSVGDSGVALGRGLVSGVKMVSDAFGADNAVSEALGGARDSLSTLESDYRKAERQRRAQRIKEADESGSTWESIKANLGSLYEAPLDTLLEAAGTMAPTVAMAAVPGLGQANLARTVATAGMGAVQGAGVVKGEIYEAVERQLLEAGVPPEEAAARAAEAQAYDGPNQGNIAAGAGLGAAAGSTGIERIIGRGGATGGLAGRVAAGAVAEGVPEAVQGGQERYASNVALQREGFDVPAWQGVAGQAALEGAAGGLLGGGVSAFSSAPVEPSPNDGPLTRAVKAGGQDPAAPVVPAIPPAASPEATPEAAPDAAVAEDAGLPAAGLTEEQEAAALSRMEAQAQSDLQGLRDFSRRGAPAVVRRAAPQNRQAQPQPGEEGSAQFVPDEAFSDRVLTLREQLADERVREQVRERFGDDALNEITYYTSLADRPDVDLPDLTRSRLLELAERGVGEALLRPIPSRPNVGANQRPEQIGAAPGVPQIGLDTAPTGTIRVDGAGRAAPETRADQIRTRQGQNEAAAERQRRNDLGLTPDVESAQARMVRPGDTLNPSGEPFKTRMAADRAAKKEGGAVVPVEGGFVVRKEQANDVAMGTGRGPGGGRAAGGADAGGSVGADGRPAAQPRGAVPGRVQADAAPAEAGGARPAGDDAALTEEALTARYDAAKEAGDSQGMMAAARELSALRRRAQEPQPSDVQDAPTRARQPETQAPADQTRAAVEGDAARAPGPADAGAPAVQADGVEVTRKGGEPFATKMAAQREVNKRGLSDSHEVVPVTGGFIARAKTRAVGEPQGRSPADVEADRLAEVLREQGYDAYVEERAKVAESYGLNANDEMSLGNLVESRVGTPAIERGRDQRDPRLRGKKAQARGEPATPPDTLSEAQKAEWLAGWDEGARSDAEQDPAPQQKEAVTLEAEPAKPATEEPAQPAADSATTDAQQESQSVPERAQAEADTPKLSQAEAKRLMEWQDLGQKDGVKTHILTFYESQANKDAKRGRMTVATITKGDRSATAWTVDGDDQRFGALGLAKKRAEEIGMAKAVADGFVAGSPAARPGADVNLSIADNGPADGGIWYSPLTRAIEGLKQNKAPAQDWKNLLNGLKQKGIKEDEIEWSGVREWLDLQTGHVTKDQVLEYLRQGGVKVEEVIFGEKQGTGLTPEEQRRYDQIGEALMWDDPVSAEDRAEHERLRKKALEFRDSIAPARYEKYTVPGGKNYREVLLKLPAQKEPELTPELKRRYELEGRNNRGEATRAEFRELLELRKKAPVPPGPNYESDHWPNQPDVLAHIRVDDRIDADGKRVLFVHEIQSDWGQEGKRKGFKASSDEAAAIKAEYDAAAQALRDAHNDGGDVQAARERLARATDAYNARINDAIIPRAPFVGKTDAWVALALKRVMKMAVDEGYDRVAIINGQQAADLYDLSRQVEQIRYIKNDDGTYDVWASDEHGSALNDTVDKQNLRPEQIEEFVGKDVAQRIIDGKGREEDGDMVLEGLDLQVGGEGMRTFYDRIVPNVVKDMLKKLGGDRVSPVRIGETSQLGFDITPKMRETLRGGAPLFSVDDGAPATDTATYGPASTEHQQLADTLAGRLSRAYGRAIVLDAVAPGSGAVGGRGRELAAVSTVARRLFGHEVVFVRFKGKPLFNGAMSTAIPDVLFLNADSKKPLMAVLGHELLHHLKRTNESIYNTLNNRLNRLKKNERDYLHKLEVLYGRQGAKAPANWDEELNADIVGDFFQDPEFWAGMAKDQPGLFRRVVNAIVKFLDDVAAQITNLRPFGTDQYLTDIGAARAAVVDAMRQFSGAQVGAMTSQSEGISLSVADDPLAHPVDSWRAKGPQVAREFIEDTLTSQRGFNRWWHRTIGTQFHKSRINPYFRRTYEAVQRYLQDTSRMANAAADEAPDLLLRIESLSDLKKMNPKDADLKAAGEAIFGGTLVDEKVYTDAELKAKGLTDKQIGYYRQFRAAVDRSLDHLVATDVIRLMTTQDLQYLGRTKGEADANLDALKELAVEEPGAVRGRLEKLILDRIAEIQAGIDGQPNQHTPGLIDKRQAAQTLLGDVREKFNRIQQLKEEGYAPLMRFGQYTVDVVDAEGERIYFGMYESQREANKAAREFRAMEGVTVRQGVQSQKEFEALKGLSPETVMLFAEMTGMEKNEAMQAWLKEAVAQQSALKRHIKRKGIAGFNPDLQRVLAAFVTSNARAASQNLHNLEVAESVESIPQSLGDVKDEALKLAQYVQNPQEEAQTIRSLMFVNYIGGSVASAVVNLSQTLVQTFPYLAQFGGAGKAAARITAAMKDAATRRVSDPDLRAAIDRAEKDGVIQPQEIFQLQAEASRNFGSNPWVRKTLTVWGSMFQLAEQFNRRAAFIAAYRTAQEQGIANPFEFAENAVAETQSVFNKGNRPNWARGAVGATLFTFKTFSIQYVEFLKRLPPKERALALAILVAAAGTQGLPFAEDLQDVLDSIAQGMGYQFSSKQAMKAMAARTLGQGAADFLQHGFSTLPGVPLDVSARLGLGNLLPGTGVLKASETRKEDEVLETFGVAGSFVRDALKGEVRPIALRNAAKALDMYQTGMYRDTRGRRVTDVDTVDAVLKGLGLQPAAVAQESRAVGAEFEARTQYNKVRGEIAEQWAQGIFEGDAKKVQSARDRLADWNAKNPQSPMRIDMPGVTRRVREMRKTRAERFVQSTNRDLRPAVREALQ